MLKTVLKLLLVGGVLLASQACTSPAATTPDPNAINTAIAQTFSAALTQTGQPGIPITGPETLTPTMTTIPTLTFTSTAAFTATAAITQITVSVATNCRSGPGAGYARVGGLLVDQVAEVVGRNSDNSYWIIQNPNRPGELCWLWGQFATVTGNPGSLPVFTPPAPPPPTATATPTITLTPMPTSTSPSPTPSPTPTSTPTP